MTQKETMEQMLTDILDQFGPNPEAYRCVNGHNCKYNPPKGSLSAGCAIGMYLSNEIAIKADTYCGIKHIIVDEPTLLPKWMRNLPVDFLVAIQRLHDKSNNWATEGLTEKGK